MLRPFCPPVAPQGCGPCRSLPFFGKLNLLKAPHACTLLSPGMQWFCGHSEGTQACVCCADAWGPSVAGSVTDFTTSLVSCPLVTECVRLLVLQACSSLGQWHRQLAVSAVGLGERDGIGSHTFRCMALYLDVFYPRA